MIDTGFALVTTGQYRRGHGTVPEESAGAAGSACARLLRLPVAEPGTPARRLDPVRVPVDAGAPSVQTVDVFQPPWAGQDLAGKTILVMVEQGAGDVIHFARYIAVLKAMGATVLLQVRPELAAAGRRDFDGVDVVFAPPEPPHHLTIYIAADGHSACARHRACDHSGGRPLRARSIRAKRKPGPAEFPEVA